MKRFGHRDLRDLFQAAGALPSSKTGWQPLQPVAYSDHKFSADSSAFSLLVRHYQTSFIISISRTAALGGLSPNDFQWLSVPIQKYLRFGSSACVRFARLLFQ